MSGNEKQKARAVATLPYMILGFIALCMLLTGCLHEPTTLSQNKVRVEEDKFTDRIAVSDFDESAMEALAVHYTKHGDGPVSLTVTYDPKFKTAHALLAGDKAAALAKRLRAHGVTQVLAGILPVKESGAAMEALVSYRAYYAHAPKDCDLMPGVENADVEAEEDYKLGCTTNTLFARQIARPKDLKGQDADTSSVDGRRLANATESYRDGVPNEPLNGESSTAQE